MARRTTTGSSRKNRFQGRGMDKFQQLFTELETKRVEIAAREGVPTTDVWFMRDTKENTEDWVPLVVRKRSKETRGSSRLQLDDRQHERQQQQQTVTIKQQDQQQQQEQQQESQYSSSCLSSSFWMKLEQILLDMQQAARRALKSISLFIVVVATVANLVVAVLAELVPSLPSFGLKKQLEEQVPRSSPNRNLVSSSSTPPLPRLRIPPSSSGSNSNRTSSPGVVRSPPKRFAPTRSNNFVPFLVTVMVILLSMEVSRVAAVLIASFSWFAFPVLKAMFITRR